MTQNYNYQNTWLTLLVDGNPRTMIFFLSEANLLGAIINATNFEDTITTGCYGCQLFKQNFTNFS